MECGGCKQGVERVWWTCTRLPGRACLPALIIINIGFRSVWRARFVPPRPELTKDESGQLSFRIHPINRSRKRTPLNSETPGSARRVLGSIERSLHKVRHVLTPKRTEGVAQPALLSTKVSQVVFLHQTMQIIRIRWWFLFGGNQQQILFQIRTITVKSRVPLMNCPLSRLQRQLHLRALARNGVSKELPE